MNLNSHKEKFIQSSRELNFEEFNKTVCNDDNFKLSQRNLIMMYIFLYDFFIKNNLNGLNDYLDKTTYFNKIIFLKYLNFFINFNDLQERIFHETNKRISKFNKKIGTLRKEIEELETEEEIGDKYEEIEDIEAKIKQNETKQININNIKQEFMVKTTNILRENTDVIQTLFDTNIVNEVYKKVITRVNDNPNSFNEYMTLFHLNPIHTNSSEKAIFYIGVHGTLYVVVPNNPNNTNNTYLTIASPIKTTINRWGEKGKEIKYFSSMDYTFKQCLLEFGENVTEFKAETCFEMLGTDIEEFNMHTRQTTPAYCVKEPDNYFSNLTDFAQNTKMRIKHYSIDSYNFEIFNNDYTLPDSLLGNLLIKIPQLENIQYNTAENIINLNFLLFTNNINFTIFNTLNINDDTRVNTFGLYSDIGLYTRYYLQQDNIYLQSDLLNFYFPLDIFSLTSSKLFIEDFTLEREIYALNNINIHLQYETVDSSNVTSNIDRSFVLLKGDSFSCNPYIIEYFIKKFNSKITIRPGPILGNKEDEIFKQNKTGEQGSTITCLSKGLSCYKVTLSVLTNYEILKFCKDANILTCDLYDTSCQSFEYINEAGQIIPKYTPPEQQKQELKRMKTIDDSTMLAKYDNLSDLLFNPVMEEPMEEPRDFLVVGEEVGQKRKFGSGGKTKKRINRKKNSYKQTKRCKQTKNKNSRKQKTKKRINRKK